MWMPRALKNVRTLKTLLTTAENVARADGQDLPDTEHLVLAALALPDGTARQTLQQLGVTEADLTAAIAAVHREALAGIGLNPGPVAVPASAAPTGPYRMTPPAQQVFQEAVALSKASDAKLLLGSHILRAASRQRYGTWARTAQRLNLPGE
jgi:ATP-dependent Clp protease ATP-binding subunit ClpA